MRRTSPRRRSAELIAGTALGCTLMVLAAAPALAEEPAGPGIRIESDAPINIDAGVISTTADDEFGVLAILDGDGSAGLNVTITGASISTSGESATAVAGVNNSGDVTIDLGQVTTTGGSATGIFANASGIGTVRADVVSTTGDGATGVAVNADGGAVVEVGEISTMGGNANGLVIYSDEGGAVIADVGQIRTEGDGAMGVQVEAMLGAPITLTGGTVSTKGYSAVGVSIYQSDEGYPDLMTDIGAVTVDLDAVETGVEGDPDAGAYSDAVRIDVHGPVNVDIDKVTTHGEMSRGVAVVGRDAVTVQVGEVSTSGGYAMGVDVFSQGDVRVEAGTVTTRGSSAFGIIADSATGSAKVSVDSLLTGGDHATGIVAHSQGGDVVVAVGALKTLGLQAVGVRAVAEAGGSGRVLVQAGSIATEGDEAIGVVAHNAGAGTTTVTADSISTKGDNARAIDMIVSGDSRITVGGLSTEGDASDAILVESQGPGDVTIETGLITTAGRSSAGVVVYGVGDVTIKTGDIRATGAADDGESDGVHVEMGAPDGVLSLDLGSVTTTGLSSGVEAWNAGRSDIRLASASAEAASAVYVHGMDLGVVGVRVTGEAKTTGAAAHAIHVVDAAEVTVVADTVSTLGDNADGVKVGPSVEPNPLLAGGVGQVRVEARDITTRGASADGVDVEATGPVAMAANRIAAFGAEARGIRVSTQGAATAAVGEVASIGEGGVGVEMAGATTALTVNGVLRGADTGALLTAVDTATVTVAGGARVSGGHDGLRLASGSGTSVTNAGTIEADSGLALDIKGGAATINNRGLLVGRVDLTAGADVLANEGTLRLRGDSNFGAGADVLGNLGTLTFVESATPTSVRLRGLERLNNTGTINLANGVAGDVLTLDGVLNGGLGNLVRMDLDTRGATTLADRLVVGGLEGVSNLRLDILGAGVLGDTGVTLVTSGAAQTGTELSITTSGGFLDYDAVFDPATREYRIVSAVDEQRAWEPTKVASGAQMQWRRAADVISARFDELRDGEALGLRRGERAQGWVQAYGGSGEVDGRRTLDDESVDLSHDVDVAGVQMGLDVVRGFAGGNLILGGAAGYGETELTFASNGDRADFSGWGLSAYAQWTKGPLALGLTARGDVYELDYDWGSVDLQDTADGQTIGVRLDAAWRIDLGSQWRVEPRASLSWTETDLDSIEAEAGKVEFGDTVSVLGNAGVRVARDFTLSDGGRLQPYVGLYAFNEFDGDNASRIHLASDVIEVADVAADQWGEVVLGANLVRGPIQVFVQGESSFGQIEGFTARVGARFNW
ncbi:autotransporter domain-containing protein [Brevundimonas sp.]|uniref:autotransporter domain-containing protein n=1 Tax=Brevundimonas sp. TaxID=1871086 RepID=UPI003F70190A